MLKEVTGAEVFDEPPILKRAHRSLSQKLADGQKSRPFVVCFHRFQDKERLLRWSRSHEILYKGNAIRIYLDFSAALSKKHTLYKGIKQSLYHKEIRFQLLYPARLRVTFEEQTFIFNSPEEAKQFYDQRVNA